MTFKYLIVDFNSGTVRGTDNGDTAEDFAQADEYTVIKTETQQILCPGLSLEPVHGFEFDDADEIDCRQDIEDRNERAA